MLIQLKFDFEKGVSAVANVPEGKKVAKVGYRAPVMADKKLAIDDAIAGVLAAVQERKVGN